MKTNQILKRSLFVSLLTTGLASANPSAVGHYGGTFAGSFVLSDPGRLHFQNAEVRVTGRLSGRLGAITFDITQNESFTDGSSISCGGSIRVPVRLAERR